MPDTDRLEQVLRKSSDSENPDVLGILDLVSAVQVVAVVGMPRNAEKAARRVPSYMATKGYDIIPVNPFADRILGKVAYANLTEIATPIDMVLVFRPSDQAGAVIEEAAARSERPAIWLQEGIRADDEAQMARRAGLTVVQDLCFFQVHRAIAEGQLRSAGSPRLQ